jgi:hypothetical protein
VFCIARGRYFQYQIGSNTISKFEVLASLQPTCRLCVLIKVHATLIGPDCGVDMNCIFRL